MSATCRHHVGNMSPSCRQLTTKLAVLDETPHSGDTKMTSTQHVCVKICWLLPLTFFVPNVHVSQAIWTLLQHAHYWDTQYLCILQNYLDNMVLAPKTTSLKNPYCIPLCMLHFTMCMLQYKSTACILYWIVNSKSAKQVNTSHCTHGAHLSCLPQPARHHLSY